MRHPCGALTPRRPCSRRFSDTAAALLPPRGRSPRKCPVGGKRHRIAADCKRNFLEWSPRAPRRPRAVFPASSPAPPAAASGCLCIRATGRCIGGPSRLWGPLSLTAHAASPIAEFGASRPPATAARGRIQALCDCTRSKMVWTNLSSESAANGSRAGGDGCRGGRLRAPPSGRSPEISSGGVGSCLRCLSATRLAVTALPTLRRSYLTSRAQSLAAMK